MNWKEICVLSDRDCIEAIAGIFNRLGSGGVVIEDPNTAPPSLKEKGGFSAFSPEITGNNMIIIKAYFTEDSPALEELGACLKKVEDNFGIRCPAFVNEVREEDWAESWKQYFHAFKVGRRLIIKPSWEDYKLENGDLVIEIDPGMAFGTGIHASTRFCLLLLDEFLQGGESVIDAGCGSGILSIAAARLGAERVLGMDIDPLAVKIAQENVELNKLEQIIKVRSGDIGAELPGMQADIIVANIIAEIIGPLIPGAAAVLPRGGWFFASGIIEERWPRLQKLLQDYGFAIEKLLREAEWVGVAARKL